MSRHVNIPIFIPHLGCPNQCVFCNQRTISGVSEFSLSDVRRQIDGALATVEDGVEVEIAFFGGSFTGIDREMMISLLDISKEYIDQGRVTSLRCSTRPDYIDEEIIAILKQYGMKTVELGLQSTSDTVLELSKRGHYFEAERNACKLIVESGMDLVGQMMIGLPGSDMQSEIATAQFIIDSGAVAARIYPTVVFRDTELYSMMKCGNYVPLSLDDAIERSCAVFNMFVDANLRVIRIGLQSSENLRSDETYAAGPNHPALGELVENELYYKRINEILSEMDLSDENIEILVSPGSLSKAVGQRKKNKLRLAEKYPNISFSESEKLSGYEILAQIRTEKK